ADLEAAGGIRALGAELAEDAASTKVVRALGLAVHLVDAPFAQPLGRRGLREVWRRPTRRARLRRAPLPHLFPPPALPRALLPALALAFIATGAGWPIGESVSAFLALWYGAEMALAWAAGWHLSALSPLVAMLRDLLLPWLWIDGLIGTDFVWRGNAMSIDDDAEPALNDAR